MRASVTADTVGDNTLVAAVAERSIVVHGCYLSADVDGTVQFESGTGGDVLSGAIHVLVAGDQTVSLPFCQVGWMKTAQGALLNLIVTGTSNTVRGVLLYSLESN
jgi:hypothetical protein